MLSSDGIKIICTNATLKPVNVFIAHFFLANFLKFCHLHVVINAFYLLFLQRQICMSVSKVAGSFFLKG